MFYILFIIYFFALVYCITKIKFVTNTEISIQIVLILFCIKIVVGIAGGLYNHFILNDIADAYGYIQQGLIEYNNLIYHSKIFFTDSLPSAYSNNSNFFGAVNSFWNNLGGNIIVKTLGVFNIFSRGNYYINSLFFNFCCFFGHIALYKIFKDIFKQQYWSIIIGAFLLPSTLCYSSIISKDLILFTAISILCYCLYFGVVQNFSKKRIAYLIFSLCTIMVIRNFVAIIIFPCAIAWLVIMRFKIKTITVFGAGMIAIISLLLIAQSLPQKINPLQIVVGRQQSFFALGLAKSQYNNDTLQNNLYSFAKATPSAARHSFLSPYPTEFKNICLNIFSVEIIAYLFLFFLLFIYPTKIYITNKSFIYFGVFFTCITFIFIGYITTNAGSLVRYRSIYFPFFIIPILCGINWSKIKNTFIKQKL